LSAPRRKPKAEAENSRAELLGALGEVFRTHGYEGASLTLITQATGLGKGSLYNFFPGGKEQMAAEVLAEIDGWFERNVFLPLRESKDAKRGVDDMFDAVERYFHSGRRVCLVGVFALGSARDHFGHGVHGYFRRWADALEGALRRSGVGAAEARERAEDILLGIQGALVLARANADPKVFGRALKRLRTT
jgi:TetR/AcrR family transcriptional repressor of lmrAB and yxaGH operons